MYTPAHFSDTDLAQLDSLLARDAFITLVTFDGGVPCANHLPVLYTRNGDDIELLGHWARPNPQWKHEGEALAIVHGPHAYVSPAWYPDKAAMNRVPTWNYAVAHLRGRLEVSDAPDFLADIVARLSVIHESAIGSDWRYEPDNEQHVRMLRGIVGFRLRVQHCQLKFKLSQNHPAANVDAVATALGGSALERDREVGQLMRERLPAS